MRVLVDGAYNLFLRPGEVKGVKVERPPREADYRRAIHNEWGLSLYLESQRAAEQRTFMLDGYTPQALLNNAELLGVDPKRVEALIVSHGHRPEHQVLAVQGMPVQGGPSLSQSGHARPPRACARATSRSCWRKARR